MRVLFSFDKFKHSLSAEEACQVAGEVADRLGWEWESSPIADGGEGFTAALASRLPGKWITSPTEDALGRPLEASWFLAEGDTAVMEMSAASGLHLVRDLPADILRASTYGTGLLMREAVKHGAKRLIVGLGGSATNDAGTGMAQGLGWKFLGADGRELGRAPECLEEVESVIPGGLSGVRIEAACDVGNPLLGENGATRIYGPQKGATEELIPKLEERLRTAERLTGVRGDFPGAGAAGGLGFGMKVFAGAELRPGFDLVADTTGLERAIERADLVITGEGRLDGQSLEGKGPHGVAKLAARKGKMVGAVCGVIDCGDPRIAEEITGLFPWRRELLQPGMDLQDAIRQAADLLRAGVEGILSDVSASMKR